MLLYIYILNKKKGTKGAEFIKNNGNHIPTHVYRYRSIPYLIYLSYIFIIFFWIYDDDAVYCRFKIQSDSLCAKIFVNGKQNKQK